MSLRSLIARRPSAALVVACAALFVSLGGVGYAAVTLPSNSVGSAQLRNGAVTYQKIAPDSVGQVRLANSAVTNSKLTSNAVGYRNIQPGSVGAVRANLNQLQSRIGTSCGAGSAIGAVSNAGKVTCNGTLPAEYGASSTSATTVSNTPATLTSVTLPAGPTYLAFANPTATVTSTGTPQRVTLSCTMTVGSGTGAGTVTRSVIIPTNGTAGDTATGSLTLQAPGIAGASTVSCSTSLPAGTTPPATVATASINALATASNN